MIPGDLERAVREIARQEALTALRGALRDVPGSRPDWTSLPRYARSCGLGTSTLRRWARAAGLERGPAGRFRTSDLEQLVARGGKPAPAPPPTVDLAERRARAAIESLAGGRR